MYLSKEDDVFMSNHLMPKILRAFVASLGFALVGFFAGSFVPPSLMIPLVIFELVILIVVLFLRKRKSIGYGFLFFFTFLTGVTTYPVIMYHVSAMGINMVLVGVLATIVVFSSLALYSWKSNRDFTFLGGFLMAALLGLIAVAILNIFFPLGSAALLVYTILGILVFSGFVLYDISVIKNLPLTEDDVPLMALNLYLDFLNLLYNILRLLGIVSGSDD